MKINSPLITLALALSSHAASIANVLSDMSVVQMHVNKLNNDVNAFPETGGSLFEAFDIHVDVRTLRGTLDRTTADINNVTPLPVSLADSQSILEAVDNLRPAIITTLNDIVGKQGLLMELPGIPELVISDLTDLMTATQAFEAALIAKAPSSLQASATSLRDTINSAFATAIAAYS